MDSLETLQKQLSGLRDLRDIVKTMKALSAASIRQYELAVEALGHYYRTVELGLHAVLRESGTGAVAEFTGRETSSSRIGLVVFGSDHGLCGRFNEDVVVHTSAYIAGLDVAATDCRVLAVGARAAGGLERYGLSVEEDLMVPGSAARITDTVQQILVKIDEWRGSGTRRLTLVYNHPLRRNTSYRTVSLEMLPVKLSRFRHLEAEPWPSRGIPGFTMSAPELLTHLLHQYFFVVIHRACAESQAAEHGSRLAAMQAADRNLADRLEEVTMSYRRARQSVITAELLDVVSGFEAISGQTRY